jgi:hypothetical protein
VPVGPRSGPRSRFSCPDSDWTANLCTKTAIMSGYDGERPRRSYPKPPPLPHKSPRAARATCRVDPPVVSNRRSRRPAGRVALTRLPPPVLRPGRPQPRQVGRLPTKIANFGEKVELTPLFHRNSRSWCRLGHVQDLCSRDGAYDRVPAATRPQRRQQARRAPIFHDREADPP